MHLQCLNLKTTSHSKRMCDLSYKLDITVCLILYVLFYLLEFSTSIRWWFEMKKYEFTGEKKEHFGVTVHRIRRLSDGLVGGWLESEYNLSHYGDCFIFDDAIVSGSASVSGSARVSGSAMVYGSAWVYGSARVSSFCLESPISVSGMRFGITIQDSIVNWGCREFDWISLNQFKYEDCTEEWDRGEFNAELAIVKDICRYKWGIK